MAHQTLRYRGESVAASAWRGGRHGSGSGSVGISEEKISMAAAAAAEKRQKISALIIKENQAA